MHRIVHAPWLIEDIEVQKPNGSGLAGFFIEQRVVNRQIELIDRIGARRKYQVGRFKIDVFVVADCIEHRYH